MLAQELTDYQAKRTQLLHMKNEMLEAFDDAVLHENWENAARFQNRTHQVERALDRINTAAFNSFLAEPVVIVLADVETAADEPAAHEFHTLEEVAAGAPDTEVGPHGTPLA
jgi:hypothetical protein